MSKKLIVGCALVSAIVSASVGMIFAARTPVVGHLPDFSALIEKDGPGVVNIRTVQKVTPIQTGSATELQELLHSYFSPPVISKRIDPDSGIGSGFFISKDGYLLTNAHVVDSASEVIVTLADHREYTAKIIGFDSRTDVALLKVDADEDLPYLPIGKSSKTKVGEWAFAIGSPFNLENTATAGIISATARDAGEYLPLIQSDVSINPGNSGGPLMNIHGDVIGINSQILQNLSGGTAGISFAIPIDAAMRIAEQLKQNGKVVRGRLGAQIAEPPGNMTLFFGTSGTRVVIVQRVVKDSSAEKAGMKAGDIILKVNDEAINGANDLPWRIGNASIGSIVKVTVLRDDEQVDLKVRVDAMDENKIEASQDVNIT